MRSTAGQTMRAAPRRRKHRPPRRRRHRCFWCIPAVSAARDRQSLVDTGVTASPLIPPRQAQASDTWSSPNAATRFALATLLDLVQVSRVFLLGRSRQGHGPRCPLICWAPDGRCTASRSLLIALRIHQDVKRRSGRPLIHSGCPSFDCGCPADGRNWPSGGPLRRLWRDPPRIAPDSDRRAIGIRTRHEGRCFSFPCASEDAITHGTDDSRQHQR
jgi:hypothetical protein